MTQRFFNCSIRECDKPSVRGTGGCDGCGRQFCLHHRSLPFHTCRNIEDDTTYVAQIELEIERLCSRINDAALCRLASYLTDGKDCTVQHFSKVGPDALMGNANYHARIRFVDGSASWLLRVPRITSSAVGLPVSLADYLVNSEYATLKFLETTTVPAPRALAYGVSGNDHGVGVSFLLMEELPGQPWHGQGVTGSNATAEEKSKIWSALADIQAELQNHSFKKAGSLIFYPGDGRIEVSAVASDRFVILDPCGPFSTAITYYTAFAEQYLTLIADGQLYTEYPVNAYLVYRFLGDTGAKQLADEDSRDEDFYLKHVDDKGDHLLVDKHLNVTGIIDWQMARVVPRYEAFGPSLVTADMTALCNGKISLTNEDLAMARVLIQNGCPNFGACIKDEKARRFFWGLGMETEWDYARPLADALLEIFGETQPFEQWRDNALTAYGSDDRLKTLIKSTQ